MTMTSRQVRRYAEQIPALAAEERLEAAIIAQLPYMLAADRRRVLEAWSAQAGLEARAAVPRVPAEHVPAFFRALAGARGR